MSIYKIPVKSVELTFFWICTSRYLRSIPDNLKIHEYRKNYSETTGRSKNNGSKKLFGVVLIEKCLYVYTLLKEYSYTRIYKW